MTFHNSSESIDSAVLKCLPRVTEVSVGFDKWQLIKRKFFHAFTTVITPCILIFFPTFPHLQGDRFQSL